MAVAAAPTSAGVLGMVRTMRAPLGRAAAIVSVRTPAATEITSFWALTTGAHSASALAMACGLTARINTDDHSASSRLLDAIPTLASAAQRSRLLTSTSLSLISLGVELACLEPAAKQRSRHISGTDESDAVVVHVKIHRAHFGQGVGLCICTVLLAYRRTWSRPMG